MSDIRLPARIGIRGGFAALLALSAFATAPAGMAAGFSLPFFVNQFGGPATAAVYPWGMAAEPDGTLLVSDYDNHSVKRYDLAGDLLGTFGSAGPALSQYNQPYSVGFDAGAGTVYVTDPVNLRFLAYDSAGNWLRTVPVSAPDLGALVYDAYLAVGADGTVYVETAPDTLSGSQATWPQRILEYDSQGNLLREFGANGGLAGQFKLLRGIGVDSAGDIYAADSSKRVVDVFHSDGTFVRQFGTPGTGPGQLGNDLRGVTVDSAGGFVYVVDAGNGVAHQYTLGGTWLQDIGRPTSGISVVGPRQLAVAQGLLCLSDYTDWRILCYGGDGSYQEQIPATPAPPPPGGFNQASGLGVDGTQGFVYVTDTFNQRVEKFTTAGAFVTQWGQRLESNPAPGSLDYPRGVAVDPGSHNVWVADTEANLVKSFDPNGNQLKSLNGGPGTPFFQPQGPLAFGGKVYVPDSGNLKLRSLANWGGSLLTTACGTSEVAGPGDLLFGCTGAAHDSLGNIYVASPADSHVYKFDPNFNLLATFGTLGGGAGQLRDPYAVAIMGSRLYVDDLANNRVAIFSTAGAWLGAFGSPGLGPGQFNQPRGLGLDATGMIYVLDSGNNRVEVFHP